MQISTGKRDNELSDLFRIRDQFERTGDRLMKYVAEEAIIAAATGHEKESRKEAKSMT